tara:strand:+ start:165 stop:350 length:186 start_codon:yes stop_codon:yes gene_type:complete
MKICFVGGGNIAQAIIDGLLKSQLPPEAIVCIERNQEKIDLLKLRKLPWHHSSAYQRMYLI